MAAANRPGRRPAAAAARRVKPAGRLAELADTKKSPTLLLGDIQAHLLAQHDKPTDRRTDIIHPSEMAKSDWCPRATNYRLSGAEPTNPGRRFSFQLETIFDEGHEIHRKWQAWLTDMGVLWGKWKCYQCGETWTGHRYDAPCGSFHYPSIQYREVALEAEDKYMIAGHEDGAVLALNALVEIKSIGIGSLRWEDPSLLRQYLVETVDGKKIYDMDSLWKGLRRPLPTHIKQTGIYLHLAKEMGLPFDRVIFLYEFKANQATKEFSVKYNPSIVEPLFDLALDVKYHVNKGTIMPRPAFAAEDAKTCKECPFYNLCWNKEPSDGTTGDTQPNDDDLGSGGRGSGRKAPTGDGGRGPAGQAGERRARTAGRPHRSVRLSADDADGAHDRVDDLHGRTPGGGGGRRVVRRRTA